MLDVEPIPTTTLSANTSGVTIIPQNGQAPGAAYVVSVSGGSYPQQQQPNQQFQYQQQYPQQQPPQYQYQQQPNYQGNSGTYVLPASAVQVTAASAYSTQGDGRVYEAVVVKDDCSKL